MPPKKRSTLEWKQYKEQVQKDVIMGFAGKKHTSGKHVPGALLREFIQYLPTNATKELGRYKAQLKGVQQEAQREGWTKLRSETALSYTNKIKELEEKVKSQSREMAWDDFIPTDIYNFPRGPPPPSGGAGSGIAT